MNDREPVQTLQVQLYGKTIGRLIHLPGDKNFFSFEESYVGLSSPPILSLSFRDRVGHLVSNTKITQTRLPPFFSNLLPEGPLREFLAERARIHSQHEFALLAALGKDLPGAITVHLGDFADVPQASQSLRKSILQKDQSPLRFSLAGVQLKFSAHKKSAHHFVIPEEGAGGHWIVKLPHASFPFVPENEYTMMELARKVGIDVPTTFLIPIQEIEGLPPSLIHEGKFAFVIQRFDRDIDDKKIHIEDFAQVFGIYPEKKYQHASYRNIAEIVWQEMEKSEVKEFVKRFIFNALIGNGDMHLKNWSLIYKDPHRPMLAPAYDFVSTIFYLPGDQLALKFMGERKFSSLNFDQFKRFAAKVEFPEKEVLETVKETVELFVQAWKTVRDYPLPKEIHQAIEAHLPTLPFFDLSQPFS